MQTVRGVVDGLWEELLNAKGCYLLIELPQALKNGR